MRHLYFLLLLFSGIFLFQESSSQPLINKNRAASPGGVPGVKVWFETKEVLGRPNYSRWVDKSGHGFILKQGTTNWVEYNEQDKEHNFNMSLWFHRDDVYFDLPFSNGGMLTTFGIFNPYQYTNEQPSEYLLYDLISYGNNQSFNMATDNLYTSGGSVNIDYGSQVGSDLWFRRDSFTLNNYSKYRTTKLLTHYKSAVPNHTIWQLSDSVRIFINKGRSGINKIWYFIPEFIVYDRYLRPLERLQVESYLARKYSLPLSSSYVSSSGSLLWDYKANFGYNQRIFYVGREDSSDLYQPRSVSSYEHYYLNNIEGTEGASETGYISTSDNRHWNNRDINRLLIFGVQEFDSASYSLNGSFAGLSDDDYYMIGDNGGSLPMVKSDNRLFSGLYFSGRTWKIRTNVLPLSKAYVSWQGSQNLILEQNDMVQNLKLQGIESGKSYRLFTSTFAQYGSPTIEFDLATVLRNHGGEIKIGFSSGNLDSDEVYYGFQILEFISTNLMHYPTFNNRSIAC